MDERASVGFLLHDVSQLVRYRFDARARTIGVTRPQWRALFNLAHDPGLNQAELADRLEVERITLCRMVDRLEDAGLVERRADPGDRRVWRLHLLPAAHAVVDRLTAIGVEIENEILTHIGEEDKHRLVACLNQLRDGLRKDDIRRDDGDKDDRGKDVA